MKKIMVLIPCRTNTTIEVAESWLGMILAFKELGYEVDMRRMRFAPVDIAMELLTREALKQDFEYVFYTSDDHVFTVNDIKQLMKVKGDMVSPMVCRKVVPFLPVIYNYDMQTIVDYPKNKVIDAVGTMCLVHRRVFDAVDEKFPGDKFFDYSKERGGDSEDLYFMKRVLACGFEPKVHTGVSFGHWGVPVYPAVYEGLYRDSVVKQLSLGLDYASDLVFIKDRKLQLKIGHLKGCGMSVELVKI